MTTTTLELDLRHSDAQCLDTGQLLSLKDAAGVRLTPLNGRIWLTMEGDKRDLELRHGVPYVIERGGLTLGYAVEPSCVRVTIPRARQEWWREWGTWLWDWLAQVGEARARARMARDDHLW